MTQFDATPMALPALQVVLLEGADAVAFAHAQFSSDVRALANGHWQFSAWLSAHGRVRAFFHLLRDADEHLRLVLRGGNATSIAAAMQRFVLRSQVSVRALDAMTVLGCTQRQVIADLCADIADGTRIAGDQMRSNLLLPGDQPRWLLLRASESAETETTPECPISTNQWMLGDIRTGLVELHPTLEDQFLPQWLGLNRLDAVSVKKGCYPGQEIIARLHFKGGNKRSLYQVTLQRNRIPEPGSAIVTRAEPSQLAGQIIMAAASGDNRIEALATIRDELARDPLDVSDCVPHAIFAVSQFA